MEENKNIDILPFLLLLTILSGNYDYSPFEQEQKQEQPTITINVYIDTKQGKCSCEKN